MTADSDNDTTIPSGNPDFSARTVLSRSQQRILLLLALVFALALVLDAHRTLMITNVTIIIFYLMFCGYKLTLQFISLYRTPAPFDRQAVPPGGWPSYTILAPLYHEKTAVPGLVAHFKVLDYPVDRLQILLLVEDDDEETKQAVADLDIAAPFEVVPIPVNQPRTKPKACNQGLSRARGDYLVIYDAEDRPETDQLRKAALRFAAAPPEVVCLQAQLNYYNRDHNWLTRFFTAEYSCWYDYCLPGLVHLDAPIPLGGTSNHFPTSRLRELGGWDPFNVTEDCDLGIRIYRFGLTTEMLDSTTWEEAVSRVPSWIRQRSRWVKGYLQTYLVHLRGHRSLLRTRGPGKLLHFHLLFGATGFCLLLNPFYWLLTLAGGFMGPDFLRGFFPFWVLVLALTSFLAGNFAFILSTMLACLRRGNYHLVPHCLLMPLYWVLMSIGAWKGAIQLITRPFYWEKTPHAGGTK